MAGVRHIASIAACIAAACLLAACASPRPPIDPDPAPTSFTVTPFLVTAELAPDGSAVSASGYVEGVIESDTSCSFVFSSGAEQFTETTTSVADASNTSCGTVTVPRDQFAPGTWTVELSYPSGGVTVDSQTITLELP